MSLTVAAMMTGIKETRAGAQDHGVSQALAYSTYYSNNNDSWDQGDESRP